MQTRRCLNCSTAGAPAKEIGNPKADRTQSFFAPRASAVIEGLLQRNAGPLPEAAVRAIYREISRAGRGEGCARPLGSSRQLHAHGEPAEVRLDDRIYQRRHRRRGVWAVSKKQADYGVVPIENSTEGIVEIRWIRSTSRT